MEDHMKSVADDIRQLTETSLRDMTTIWRELFDEDFVKNNLTKLVEHVQCFYAEIAEETEARKNKIEQKVAELEREQRRLTAILKCDLSIERSPDKPLFSYQRDLDQALEKFREQVHEREVHIQVLLKSESELCERLDSRARGIEYSDVQLPSQEDIDDFEFYLDELKALCAERQETSRDLQRQIRETAAEIELDINSRLMSPDQKLSADYIEALKQLLAKMCTDRYNIKSEIADKLKTLEGLYACLELSPRSRLVHDSTTKLTKTTSKKLDVEIERCEKLKRANIKRIIEKVRLQIEEYWELTMMTDKERARFSNFTNDCYTEDLLLLHEMELNDLKQFYNGNIDIFEKYHQHMELWHEALAIEARENDPNRFKNRGGKLLSEGRARKRIDLALAKLRQELAVLAAQYEAEQNRPFTIRGASVVDTIEELYASRRMVKEQQMSARKAISTTRVGLTPNSVTMSASRAMAQTRTPMSVTRTPMSVTRCGDKSAMLKRAASTTKLNFTPSASKRPKITLTSTTSTVTPAKTPLAKRNILSELTPSAVKTPNDVNSKFRKPIARKPAKVIDSLINGVNRRKSSHSRRSSANKSMKKSSKTSSTATEDSDRSYVQFEEEMTVRSRSSIKPKPVTANKLRPPTPRRKSRGMQIAQLPNSSSMSMLHTPSPRSKRLPEFF